MPEQTFEEKINRIKNIIYQYSPESFLNEDIGEILDELDKMYKTLEDDKARLKYIAENLLEILRKSTD